MDRPASPLHLSIAQGLGPKTGRRNRAARRPAGLRAEAQSAARLTVCERFEENLLVEKIAVLIFVVAVLLILGVVGVVWLLAGVYRVLHGEKVARKDESGGYIQPRQDCFLEEAERGTRSSGVEPPLPVGQEAGARTACEKCDSFDTIRPTEFGQLCIFCELEARAARSIEHR